MGAVSDNGGLYGNVLAMTETAPKLQTSAPWNGLKIPVLHGVMQRYGLAIAAFALALGLNFLLESLFLLRGDAFYLFFLPAILIASAYSGWGPGLLATLLGLLFGLFFVVDFRSLTTADVVNAVSFVVVGIGVSWRGELLGRARASAWRACGGR